MISGLGKVEDAALGGDRSDQAFAHAELGHVDRLLPEAMGSEQFELAVAQQVD